MFARGLTNISMTSRLIVSLHLCNLGCIVVFPDVMTTLVGTQYLNFLPLGIMERDTDEILPFVQQKFRQWKSGVGSFFWWLWCFTLPRFSQKNYAVSCQAGDMGFLRGTVVIYRFQSVPFAKQDLR